MTTQGASSNSARIASVISKAAAVSKDEKELRQQVHPLLEGYLREHGSDLPLRFRQERMLANGRIDTVFNRLVLEYKRPNSFTSKRKVADVLTQLQIYIEDLAEEERWTKERLLGVAFDGCHFVYLKFLGRWVRGTPIPVSPQSVNEFLRYLLKLTDRAALIPENLIRDFAISKDAGNQLATNAIHAFYQALLGDHSRRTKALFDQWAEQFSDVHGAFDQNRKFNKETLRRSYAFNTKEEVHLLPFFFALETYFSFLMKLLAYQVVGYYLEKKSGLPLASWERYGSEQLRDELTRLDDGRLFHEKKIRNFIEGDFFGWYLSDWCDPIESAVRELVKRVNEYDPETLEVEPEYTRDLLKQLYQYLIPPQIRHDLGEYYTPDWLAERVLNQLNYGEREKNLLDKRLLDPGCGSGTFLILAIGRAMAHARRYKVRPAVALQKIVMNIQGFDLNPLAVIAARANYLLALSDLLPYKSDLPGGELRIPVYLCDSIKPPRAEKKIERTVKHKDLLGKEEIHTEVVEVEPYYEFRTSVGKFRFAEPMVTKQRLQRLTPLFEDCVKRHLPEQRFLKRVREELDFTEAEWAASEPYLKETFARLSDLDAKGINGIWANILKNAFAPLFVGTFDLIAGNPPWVNWSALPQSYRHSTAPLWQKYGIFTHKGLKARLGSACDDISILMTYVALERYCNESGRLGFVITQSVFKSAGGGEGFRRFRIGTVGPFFSIEQVDDMVGIQPFEAATNRTAIFSCRKGVATKYPVPYTLWRKKSGGAISSKLTFAEVLEATERRLLKAKPVGSSSVGPWITAHGLALAALEKVVGKAPYKARVGFHSGGANGIYWVRVTGISGASVSIQNMHDVGKKKVEPVSTDIEADLIFPAIRGRDVERWKSSPSIYLISPQDPDKLGSAVAEKVLEAHWPLTFSYFSHFRHFLIARSHYKKHFENADMPFYATFNVGPYTFAPWKVVWSEIGDEIDAAVVSCFQSVALGTKVVVPDHTVIAIAVASETEAHYICALLNCACTRLVVKGYVVLHPSPHVLTHLGIPQFDSKNSLHNDFAQLSRSCHEKTGAGVPVTDLEEQIDELAAELWGLTDNEMAAIRESLAVLSPPRKRRRKDGAMKTLEEEVEEEKGDDR